MDFKITNNSFPTFSVIFDQECQFQHNVEVEL